VTPEVWRQVEDLYNDLVDQNPTAWPAALAKIEDSSIREEVRLLLDAGPIPAEFGGAIKSLAREASLAHLRFGPWRAVRIIGHGGMGAVYEAVRDDGTFEQKAAVKILQTGVEHPAARERFIQEREILASLNHPNIAHLIDGGETASGVSYIVMEFVDGEPVTHWCVARKPTREQILRLFLKICSGVEYAHHRLIVHRDIKPANILVTADGTPKLLDFGIAKLLDQSGAVTRTGFHPLTPAYASPEQFLGQPITTATDVYSLGVVLYEMLTGRAPFPMPSTSSPVAITRTVCESPPEPPGIATDLDNILLMALRKEPERRYGSVGAFAADIESFLAKRPVTAREDSLGYRTSRFLQRNARVVIAVSLIFLALAGGVIASQYQARRAQRHFLETRGLADDVLAGIDTQLGEIPGTVNARRYLIDIVLRRLERLYADTGGDAGLEAELTIAYQRAGALLLTLPDAEPRVILERAIELGERVRARGTTDPRFLEALARAYSLEGVRLYELGKYAQARENLLRAIERTHAPGFQRGAMVASSANRYLARLEYESGQIAQAVRFSEDAMRAAAQAVEEERTPKTVGELVAVRYFLGRVVTLAGDLNRVAELADLNIRDAEAIYQANPASNEAKLALVTGYLTGGSVPPDIPGHEVKPEIVEMAIQLAKAMTQAEPNITYWRNWTLVAYVNQYYRAKDLATATAAARGAMTVSETMVENQRTVVTLRNRAFVRILLADTLRRAGDHLGAVEQATIGSRELTQEFSDREAKADILLATLVLARAYEDGHDKGRAAERYEAARKLSESLYAADPSDLRMAAFLAVTYEGLGRTALRPAAADYFAKSVAIWKSWAVQGKSTAYDQGHLAQAEKLLEAARR